MSVRLVLERGGEARAESFDGKVLSCVSPRAFAPGAPIRFRAELPSGERALDGKSLGSKRREDGAFTVRMRLVSLRREAREALVEALPG